MLNPDFRDILSEFVACEVDFLVVGAYALAAYGLPRATGDIDLWVCCNPENAPRIIAALRQFGAPLGDISEADFESPGMIVQVGVVPYRVDVLTEIDGVEFNEAWLGRSNIEIDALRMPVISVRHLLQNKRASGRPKDLADVRKLEKKYGELTD